MRGDGVPDDFVAFLERRAADLVTAGPNGTSAQGAGETWAAGESWAAGDGGTGLSAGERDKVLVTLARRWWRLRLEARHLGRVRAADDLLDRMLVERGSRWDFTAASLTVGQVRAPGRATTSILDRPPSTGDLAGFAWREAIRARRLFVAGTVGVVLAGLVLLAIPRHSEPDAVPVVESPVPVVTARPAWTDVVPTPERLTSLPRLAVPGLPSSIDISVTDRTKSVAASPVHRATAVFEPDNSSTLMVLGDDGVARLLDASVPVNARLTSTSLSADGTQLALLSDRQVTVVSLASGTSHGYQVDIAQTLTTLIWLSPTSVAVSDSTSTVILDLKTGMTRSTEYAAGALLQTQPAGSIVELISVDEPPGTPARVRHWAGEDTFIASLSPGTGANINWLGGWQGAGWQRDGMLVRDAATLGLALPLADSPIGVAGAATVVVDEGTGGVRRVLAFPGNPAALAVLGFLDPQTVLLRAGDETAFGIIAWRWDTGELRLVSRVDRVSVVSLAMR